MKPKDNEFANIQGVPDQIFQFERGFTLKLCMLDHNLVKSKLIWQWNNIFALSTYLWTTDIQPNYLTQLFNQAFMVWIAIQKVLGSNLTQGNAWSNTFTKKCTISIIFEKSNFAIKIVSFSNQFLLYQVGV